jgi:hypothetical protein
MQQVNPCGVDFGKQHANGFCGVHLLSQIGIGALQFPDGKHVISGAPIKELPLEHDSKTFVFIFVFGVLRFMPRRGGIIGQCTAD